MSSNLINNLLNEKYIIWNVSDKKMPLLPKGVSWSNCSYNDIKDSINLNNESFGIRTGLQENNKYIIGLDFDTYIKVNGEYEQCNNTRKLLKQFEQLNKNNDGLFISSTEGNRGCLVDITECKSLIELIEKDGRRKIQKQNYCLEILTSFNMVIPPTKTICKIRKQALTNRKFLNPKQPFLILNEDNDIYDFIYNYIEESSLNNKVENKTLKKYNRELNYLNLIDNIENDTNTITMDDKTILSFLKLLSIERIKNYNTWFKIGLALKNIIEDNEQGLIIFNEWSKLDKDSYNKSSIKKYWNIWDNYKNKYNGLNINYILNCVNNDNPNKFYIAYYEYLQSTKNKEYNDKKIAFEKEVLKVLEPPIYLNFISYHNKWQICTYSEIEHKYLEKYGKEFLNEYFKDENKNVFDVYDFIPDNNLKERKDIKIFNSFTGFRINEIKNNNIVNCDKILTHIKNLCGNNENTYNFLIQWLSHLFFNTTKRCFIVPVIKGEEGTGKGTIYNIIERIIGKKYCVMTSTPENDIFSRFNDLLHEKIFININEAEFNNFNKTMENFKSLIADNTFNLEEKGKKKITLNNYIWFMVTTNNEKLFNISSSNRRFYFIEADNKIANNKEYFDNLYNDIDNDNIIYSFYKYLEGIYNPNFNFNDAMKNNKTTYHKALEVNSKNSFYIFFNEYLEQLEQDEIYLYIKPMDLIAEYKRYCINNNDSIKETGKSIKLKLTLLGVEHGRFKYNDLQTTYYKFKKNDIVDILKEKNYI